MTDDELHASTIRAVRLDMQAQMVTITHLMEVASRRLYSKLGFSSIFSYAVSALGFSEPAAGVRIQAMRLAQSVPQALTKMASGELSISAAASIQRFIRKEEKVSDRIWRREDKERIIQEVAGLSARDTAKTLLSFATQVEPHVLKEKIIPLTSTRTQLTFYVGPETMADVERVKELKGDLTLEEIFKMTLSLYLDRTDPARKAMPKSMKKAPAESAQTAEPAPAPDNTRSEQTPNTSESASSRYIPVALRQALQQRSGGRCEYVSSKTGPRCDSRFRLEVEHRIPYSHGGPTTLDNCLYYCSSCNLTAAINLFGNHKMKPSLKSPG